MARNNNIASALQGMSEAQARRVLQEEGRKLERIARSVWRAYLASYTPKEYARHLGKPSGVRTGNSERAIKLKQVKRTGINEFGIELTWENDLVYHDSVMNHKKGHAVMLISSGWTSSRGRNKDVYRFGYYEGFDYLGKVEKTYNAMKHPQVYLEIQWSGKYLK
ncbi:virion structural protein [Bacillus phage vB_BcoS-136]|uniref:Uncharacterized protein n=1 Tax=Bacillus phage vB_BcoS-136 TaxID=2419619 RepID=A0A3G3BVI0_9CAUD|nr:virion structural protein [Bacillus phage vB_BcoS-136]AYP68257.1 hypothetical protein vBBcoS136_00142 [Bacillus phage vB_BcoS-136]